MTPKTELRDFFACAAENAARMFNTSDDHEVLPMWHAVNRSDEHIIIATPWSNDFEKNAVEHHLRKMFQATGVKRLAFISEAWVATIHKPSAETLANPPRPSEHPDRREVLMISAENREGDSLSGFFYILRPEHGTPKLSPLHMNDYDQMSGRFTGMLGGVR